MKRIAFLILFFPAMLHAQPLPERPQVGLLLQSGMSIYFQEHAQGPYSGFQVYTARLRLRGRLQQELTYTLQTDFTRSNLLLDARVVYRFRPRVALAIGQFKAPFSAEALTSAAQLDFISRARIVSQQAPGRQVGMQIAFQSPSRRFQWAGGIFNGDSRRPTGNADAQLLYASRLESQWFPESPLCVGLSGAITSSGDIRSGIDLRFQQKNWFLSAEWIEARQAHRRYDRGFHLSSGLFVTRTLQALIRLDALQPSEGERDELLIVGLNLGTSRRFFAQVNYFIPLRDAALSQHYILTKIQVNI